jgi:predicted nuclease of predicted toxin-antitoxin system
MIRLATDENFNGHILEGLLRRNPDIDIVRVQDIGLAEAVDPTILEWAASENRVLLTHDVTTMTHFAYERMRRGEPVSGVVVMDEGIPIGSAIEDILLLVGANTENELRDRVWYLPL